MDTKFSEINKYRVGQKVNSGFPITSYRKNLNELFGLANINILAYPILIIRFMVTKRYMYIHTYTQIDHRVHTMQLPELMYIAVQKRK